MGKTKGATKDERSIQQKSVQQTATGTGTGISTLTATAVSTAISGTGPKQKREGSRVSKVKDSKNKKESAVEKLDGKEQKKNDGKEQKKSAEKPKKNTKEATKEVTKEATKEVTKDVTKEATKEEVQVDVRRDSKEAVDVEMEEKPTVDKLAAISRLWDKQKKDQVMAAKEEEKKYLKLRAAQVLDQYKPKSKAAQLRGSDDKFPVNYAKQMEKLKMMDNFGAVKAMYLAMRPNGKYAAWEGKEYDDMRKNQKTVPLRELFRRARCGGQPVVVEKPKEVEKNKDKKQKKTTVVAAKPKGQKMTAGELANLPVLPVIGVNEPLPKRTESPPPKEDCPMDASGNPWWMAEADNVSTDTLSEIEKDVVNVGNMNLQGKYAIMLEDENSMVFRKESTTFYHYTGTKEKMAELDRYFELERFHDKIDAEEKRGPVFYNTIIAVAAGYDGEKVIPKFSTNEAKNRPFLRVDNEMTVFKYKPGVVNYRGHEEEMKKSGVKKPFVEVQKPGEEK